MTPKQRFEKLENDYPRPWSIVCQYISGTYYPTEIIDANGKRVISCEWASLTPEGMHMYACIVEAVGDRIEYGNPWDKRG